MTETPEQETARRARQRADRLAKKADKLTTESEQRSERAFEMYGRFAGGQPLLPGHHSYRSARRAKNRADAPPAAPRHLTRRTTRTQTTDQEGPPDMRHNADRARREAIEQYGPAPTTPTEALAHVVAVWEGEPDGRMMVDATSNVYGPGVRTGLTLGDLRVLHADLTRLRGAVADTSGIYDDGDTYGPRPA